MPAQKVTAQRIVEISLDLFSQRGYLGCTMNEIAAACGIQKASLYHHYASKAELLKAAVLHLMSLFETHVFSYAHAVQYGPEERMRTMLDGLGYYGLERNYSTLLVRVGAEAYHDVPELTPLLSSYYDAWQQAFAHLFLEAGHMQPNRSALQCLCELQGALLVSSLQRRPELYAQATHHVMQRLGWHGESSPISAGASMAVSVSANIGSY
jgi:AcrR family transcriptional regulator